MLWQRVSSPVRRSNNLLHVARLPELENEVKQLKESLEAANYKLGLADGKVESLQNALKSAEARAATLELQSKSRVMASGDEVIELTSAEKDAEVCLRLLFVTSPHFVACASLQVRHRPGQVCLSSRKQ